MSNKRMVYMFLEAGTTSQANCNRSTPLLLSAALPEGDASKESAMSRSLATLRTTFIYLLLAVLSLLYARSGVRY